MRTAAWLRRIALALALLVLALAVLTARVVIDGERALQASDEAFDQGDVRAATVHARRAAVLYAPGAPHVPPAYERLIAIASGAEVAGDPETAVLAWQSVRGAALETRHIWTPHLRELEQANRNLARLQLPADGSVKIRREVASKASAELARDDAPRVRWVLLLALGFSATLAGLGVAAWRGVTPDGELVLGPLRVGVVLVLLGFGCWVTAVLSA